MVLIRISLNFLFPVLALDKFNCRHFQTRSGCDPHASLRKMNVFHQLRRSLVILKVALSSNHGVFGMNRLPSAIPSKSRKERVLLRRGSLEEKSSFVRNESQRQ
jgi:hypothetical protein